MLLEIYLPPELSKASETYHIRLMKLYLIMTKLLQAAECQGILDQLDSQVTPNNGVLLLFVATEAILSCTSSQTREVFSDIGSCLQLNDETIESFGTWMEHFFHLTQES